MKSCVHVPQAWIGTKPHLIYSGKLLTSQDGQVVEFGSGGSPVVWGGRKPDALCAGKSEQAKNESLWFFLVDMWPPATLFDPNQCSWWPRGTGVSQECCVGRPMVWITSRATCSGLKPLVESDRGGKQASAQRRKELQQRGKCRAFQKKGRKRENMCKGSQLFGVFREILELRCPFEAWCLNLLKSLHVSVVTKHGGRAAGARALPW